MTLIAPLAEAGDAAVVGGKGASLGELIRAGIPVPPGFAVTVDAFTLAMAVTDPAGGQRARIGELGASDLAGIARIAGTFRKKVAKGRVPDAVAEAVTRSYAALGDSPLVAVRSSATMEDGAAASFAGLQDTYLGVRGAGDVLDAIRRCWASLYNDESVAYRRRIGLPEPSLSMAVVVQVMVAPRAAGVMFTRSPASGDRSVVTIEGTWGLGSALVAGDVTPDSFTISKVTGEITARRISDKAVIHPLGQNGPSPGPAGLPLPTPAELRGQPCLADDEIRALAATARRVEAHYGTPQDIEWALLEGDTPAGDRVILLQSRPETAWSARDTAAAPVAAPRPRAADHVLSLFSQHLSQPSGRPSP